MKFRDGLIMNSMYFYRTEIIQRTPCGKGWYWQIKPEADIYKTIEDAKNGIDKICGGFTTAIIPKRHDKPIKIIGKMIFVLDNVDDQGKVENHYEYEWYDK